LSSVDLGALYAPVVAILLADRGQQVNRIAEMFLEIVEARDAEALEDKEMFELGAGHMGAEALNDQYRPLIAILLAGRESQAKFISLLQQQVRDSRDGEIMQMRKVGEFKDSKPVPLITPRTAALLAPQGGVKTAGLSMARPPNGPPNDLEED